MKAKRPAALNIGIDRNPIVLTQTAHEIQPDPLIISGDGYRQVSPDMMSGAPITINDDESSHYVFFSCDAMAFVCGYPFNGSELCYFDPPYLMATRRSQDRIARPSAFCEVVFSSMLTICGEGASVGPHHHFWREDPASPKVVRAPGVSPYLAREA